MDEHQFCEEKIETLNQKIITLQLKVQNEQLSKVSYQHSFEIASREIKELRQEIARKEELFRAIAGKTCVAGYDSGDSAVYELATEGMKTPDIGLYSTTQAVAAKILGQDPT